MNAQEAIERMEQEIEELNESIKSHYEFHVAMTGGLNTEVSKAIMSSLSSKKKALSVVLESAKFLHNELELKVMDGYEENEVVEIETLVGVMTDRNGLKSIGIEEGANHD